MGFSVQLCNLRKWFVSHVHMKKDKKGFKTAAKVFL